MINHKSLALDRISTTPFLFTFNISFLERFLWLFLWREVISRDGEEIHFAMIINGNFYTNQLILLPQLFLPNFQI